ncbi:hypothetical protein FB451DRAFT_1434630 [Mycena latifolia]|nr:hypothetical protein FB451DRAFT_1434630 [Mycena latifolia]
MSRDSALFCEYRGFIGAAKIRWRVSGRKYSVVGPGTLLVRRNTVLQTTNACLAPAKEKQRHHPCLAFRARITHPRCEIAEAQSHSLGERHPHRKGTARRLKSAPTRTSAPNVAPNFAVTPRPARLRRPHTLTGLASARRGSNPRSRRRDSSSTSASRREAHAAFDRTCGQRAREDGGAAARTEALALTADSQLPVGKPARASAGEMRRAVASEVEEKETRVAARGAAGRAGQWTAGARRRRGRSRARWCRSSELKDKGRTYTMGRQVLEIRAVQETIKDLLACTGTHRAAAHARDPPPPADASERRLGRARRRRGDAHERAHSVSTLRIRGPRAHGAGALNRVDAAGNAGRRSVSVKAPQRSASIGIRACARWGSSARRACHGTLFDGALYQ